MNWKLGLLRTWIFVSVFWLVGAGGFAVLDNSPYRRLPESKYIRPTEADLAECIADSFLDEATTPGIRTVCEDVLTRKFATDWNLPERDVIIFIVSMPVALLVLGTAVAWVVGGFRGSD